MRRLSLPIFHHFPHQNPHINDNNTLFLPKKTRPNSSSSSNNNKCVRMSSNTNNNKIVVIMGPTGCGKSKLSVDLATRFFPNSEIINSDKIQVYRGLDITTNKTPLHDRKNVPHHLLGEFDPHPEFTPSDFRSAASSTISQIISRRRIPFIVGGSNSFIYALLANKFNPNNNYYYYYRRDDLRYKCCFIWVDVSLPILNRYLVKRVDDMLDSGMYEELSEYFGSGSGVNNYYNIGLNKAIGVPEFGRYFNGGGGSYEEAVREIKDNTCQLAKRQMGKILRLRDDLGWELKRVDATASVMAAMNGRRVISEIVWEREVVEPSVKIVKRFLDGVSTE